MSIQVLSPEVIDQIAAGEVVERPAHLVKELVENSLDAGAKNLEIEVSQGGRLVKIQDDGIGIPQEELPLALARHATSKISISSDIWGLSTYGFRGEALASIAAVSRLEMTSRPENQKLGSRIHSEFGRLGEVEPVGHSRGTTVYISELFTNVPARLKFLKSETAELAQIKATLKAMGMAYPGVSFRIKINGELFAYWAARSDSRRERVEEVLGQSPMYEGLGQCEGVKAQAILSPPHVTSKQSRQIWLFVQGRWVQDRGLQAAVMDAYRNLLMHGEYPIATVFVTCDPEDVDVNIHPTKSQVKFLKPSDAYRAVHRAVREELEKAPWVAQVTGVTSGSWADVAKSTSPEAPRLEESGSFSGYEFDVTQLAKKPSFGSLKEQMVTYRAPVNPPREFKPLDEARMEPTPPQPVAQWSRLQVLGQAKQTYILAQNDFGIILIDQHAAHERILFEKLQSGWRGEQLEIQRYLLPLTVQLEAEAVERILEAKEDWQRLGLELEAMGPQTLAIQSAPAILKETALSEAIQKMGEELQAGGSRSLERVLNSICATMACHSAVRAGQALSLDEMQALLRQMDEFPLSSFCPHGRPVFVEYPFSRLERDFGRIV